MPITEFQRIVLKLLAVNRSPESHIGGGIAIHSESGSPRYSSDVDVFHDSQQVTLQAAIADTEVLLGQKFGVEWLVKQPGFCRAIVSKGVDTLKLEWVHDSAYRFFPAVPDPDLGYRLHPADVATNKILAAGSRRESRDFVDLLYLHASFLHVGALIWAACDKDPGFSPESLLEHIDRNKVVSPPELLQLQLALPLDPRWIRESWIGVKQQSSELFNTLPADEVGCLYLDPRTQAAVYPQATGSNFAALIRHRGTLRGSWPKVAD